MKPVVLVTNDDGIDSEFLHLLVKALTEHFRVHIAAPADEQSWIGRAMSRRKDIHVVDRIAEFPDCESAWSISGTPTDCINIALGNLLEEPPDTVVSGINIGYNTTEALILSSGTIAGAFEGALWGLPAIAFSQSVPSEVFESVRDTNGQTKGSFSDTLRCSASHAARITLSTLSSPPPKGHVININFPEQTSADTQLRDAVPAKIHLGSLYKEKSPGVFGFHFHEGITVEPDTQSDRAALEAGYISQSILDFSRIGSLP